MDKQISFLYGFLAGAIVGTVVSALLFLGSCALAQALPGSLSSAAAPLPTPVVPIPLVFAYQDTTSNRGPVYCPTGFPVAVGDSLTFGLNGPSVPATVNILINGNPFASVAVPTATVLVSGIPFHVLGSLTADVAGRWTLTVTAAGYTANPLTVTAQ